MKNKNKTNKVKNLYKSIKYRVLKHFYRYQIEVFLLWRFLIWKGLIFNERMIKHLNLLGRVPCRRTEQYLNNTWKSIYVQSRHGEKDNLFTIQVDVNLIRPYGIYTISSDYNSPPPPRKFYCTAGETRHGILRARRGVLCSIVWIII